MGENHGETGTASVNAMGSGHLSGLHYTTAGNIPLMLARALDPGWSHPGPFLSALGRSQRPSGAWGWGKNRPCQRPIPLPPLPRNPVTPV